MLCSALAAGGGGPTDSGRGKGARLVLHSKSMVSRVLSGERSLSKKHIQALAKRFGVSPAVFFLQTAERGQHQTLTS